jgi:acetyl esterase/lipase
VLTRSLLFVAALLALVAIWIVAPAPIHALLPLGVAAPELSPVLGVLALMAGVIALRLRGTARVVIVGLALVTAGLASIPLLQWRATRDRFDDLTRALPAPAAPAPTGGNVTVVRGVTFAETADRPLTVDLYRSGADGLLPVVIQIHGGAWRSGEPGDDARFAVTLARRGYLVAAVSYRLVPASRWPAQIDDVRAAIEWVAAHAGEYGGDADEMALVGRSAGAQLALVAAYTSPERVKAVVSLYGPTDLAEGWRVPPTPDPLPVRPVLEAFLGGTPAEVPQRYAAASPITYVSRQAPPTLLIYGARDHIVEARFGRELHNRLAAAGATSVYLEVPWAEHAFDVIPGLSTRLVQPYIERFLAAHIH